MDKQSISNLINRALDARHRAYTPYSHFKVGAALLTSDGEVYQGCNIENAAFGSTMCAERTAMFKAVSEGHTEFKAIAVVGGEGNSEPTAICPPCGNCRQVMAEFADEDFRVILAVDEDNYQDFSMDEVLPLIFHNLDPEE
ncbi:MAG: cytidine deaminase [Clostridiales bacterium]|nr:cytidine deaminase [Candidatus Crickella caballi]